MTKRAVLEHKGHPKRQKLSDAVKEDADRRKALNANGISKSATLVATDKDADVAAELAVADNMRPTDEQLAKINQFTRSTKTADEVAAFKTLSCNDIVDRDDDVFSKDCVKGFAQLEQPFSPTGKSFMLDHSRSTGQQIGRIFDTESKKISGAQWLVNDVYVPNTEANKTYLENVDFGVHWAVSVGVVLGSDQCTVCKSPFSSWGYWCLEGHDKGLYYDPNSDETDNWGYPAPCDPSTAGAVKCVRQFDNPIDMYELSQVFLGAQYFAALDKDPAFKAAMKAAGNVPIVGLGAAEADKLSLPHMPDQVTEAHQKFTVDRAEDGSLNWTDAHGVRWTFDPEEPDEGVMSLGKVSKETDSSDEDEEDEDNDGVSEEQLPPGDGDQADDEEDEPGEPEGDGSGSVEDQAEADGEQQGGEQGEVVAAAVAAGVSDSIIKRLRKAPKGLELATLLTAMQADHDKVVSDLTPKAELGSAYIEELRSDAIHWYTVARQEPGKADQPVNVDSFRKILDACGENVELIKALIEDNKGTAQAKFPRSNRRSSFTPEDPNSPNLSEVPQFEAQNEDGRFDARVRSIHG